MVFLFQKILYQGCFGICRSHIQKMKEKKLWKWTKPYAPMTNVCLLKMRYFSNRNEVTLAMSCFFSCWFTFTDGIRTMFTVRKPVFHLKKKKINKNTVWQCVRMWNHKFRMICTNWLYLTWFSVTREYDMNGWNFAHFHSHIYFFLFFFTRHHRPSHRFDMCNVMDDMVWRCVKVFGSQGSENKIRCLSCFSLPIPFLFTTSYLLFIIIIKCASHSN